MWNPYRQGLIKELEKVQMKGTKLVITLNYLPYMGRLICLNLLTIKYRLIPEDMIEVYKILTNRIILSRELRRSRFI